VVSLGPQWFLPTITLGSLLSRPNSLNLTLPPNGSPLPDSVSPPIVLKLIAPGVGTHNYTCALAPNTDAVSSSVSAKVSLSDGGAFLQNHAY
jgi:hypothetical protein